MIDIIEHFLDLRIEHRANAADVEALDSLIYQAAVSSETKLTPKVIRSIAGKMFIRDVKTNEWLDVAADLNKARSALKSYNADHTRALRLGLVKDFGLRPGGRNPLWPEWEPSDPAIIQELNKRASESKPKLTRVPPLSWDLWVNPDPNGHPLATWRSLNGLQKQMPHPDKIKLREEKKFTSLKLLQKVIPRIREKYLNDLRRPELDEPRVRAAAVLLMDRYGLRGGEERHLQKETRGAATLYVSDVKEIKGDRVKLYYVSKAAVNHITEVKHPDFARLVTEEVKLRRKMLEPDLAKRLWLFRTSNGDLKFLRLRRINDWLDSMGLGTAKDFRMFRSNVAAMEYLKSAPQPTSWEEAQRTVEEAIKHAAKVIGHSEDQAKNAYVNAALMDAWAKGFGFAPSKPKIKLKPKTDSPEPPPKTRITLTPKKKEKTKIDVKQKTSSVIVPKRNLTNVEEEFFDWLDHVEEKYKELGIDPDKDYEDAF